MFSESKGVHRVCFFKRSKKKPVLVSDKARHAERPSPQRTRPDPDIPDPARRSRGTVSLARPKRITCVSESHFLRRLVARLLAQELLHHGDASSPPTVVFDLPSIGSDGEASSSPGDLGSRRPLLLPLAVVIFPSLNVSRIGRPAFSRGCFRVFSPALQVVGSAARARCSQISFVAFSGVRVYDPG